MKVMARTHKNDPRADSPGTRADNEDSRQDSAEQQGGAEQHSSAEQQESTSPQGADGKRKCCRRSPQGESCFTKLLFTSNSAGVSAGQRGEIVSSTARWSRRRWLATIAALVVGAVLVALIVNLISDPSAKDPNALSVGGALQAGPDFAHAAKGSCLTWDEQGEDGQIASLREVPCGEAHRFEVAGIIDLSMYPSHHFATGANPLSDKQVESLRLGLCRPLVDSYLPQGLDPAGRFRVGILRPDVDAWNRGDRTLVCGVESTNPTIPTFTGKVSKQDQSIAWETGSCVRVNPQQHYDVQKVKCSDPHMLEIVGTVSLTAKFGERLPSKKQQSSYSEKQCVALATSYMGGAEKLRLTTLTVVWSRVSLAGWNSGSRKVTCALAKANKDGFATLSGSAKDSFTIDGKKPKKPAKLPPKGNQLPDMHNDPLLKDSVPGL